ncbi:small ribosomal subunit protein mS31 [Tenrec ecaudatus]|uniref:small ribosomal subunit protein mS31 n=1 Tax=Tenrec ecaudatus TaxID=94439 RepID=UPI003F59EC2F
MAALLPRLSAFAPRPALSRLPRSNGRAEGAATAARPLAASPGALRTKDNTQRYFGTNNVICNKKDEQAGPDPELSRGTSKKPGSAMESMKKNLLNVIKDMKIEVSTVNVQTAKPPDRRPIRDMAATIGKLRKSKDRAFRKRQEPLSPKLVAAASAVAESLPFDKQTTKSELLRQLRLHEQASQAQEDSQRQKVSFSNIITDMKIAKSGKARASTRPEHQIQFDEEPENYRDYQQSAEFRKSLRKNLSQGKRLNIFDSKTDDEEPETEPSPSIWDLELAKQLAAVSQQPFQNGFEEVIQWTKEGKLWTFPIDNEAGFDDDGSAFHEHIFLDKHLEDFPKQGPIRHFMELVTCGLSKNPDLSVKQKIEHIEWFRNYFSEKKDILKESDIQFN